jgi:CubicO group peptidase (beta-lactamase class C family)
MARTSGRLLTLLTLLLGCPPANDVVDNHGETGDDVGVPIAADPFGGEGSDPPGEPDASLDWPQPLTLGNGLVHDSRYDLQAGASRKPFTAAQLVAGVDWTGFVDSHALKLQNGFRPTQVDAEVTMKNNLDETIELTVVDRSVYVSDDDANYKTKIKTFVFGNTTQETSLNGGSAAGSGQPRPTSIDTFALPGGRVGATVALVYDNDPAAWELVVGQNLATFRATIAALAGKGFRPISVSSRRRNGASEYAGIFVQDWLDAKDWHVMLGHDAAKLAAEVSIKWDAGYYPFSGGYEQGSRGWPRFNVLWIRRSPGLKLELRVNMNEITFEGEDRDWRQRGYHLEGACAYEDAGLPRYAGLWVRHEPYMRWRDGMTVNEKDPDYVARYEPFHQQAMQAMTLAGSPAQGEYLRPSATLHIFEGDELVFNRAYTYAGAAYPETPLNATFALASASKSITAAAVVLELQKKGISLNAPFAATAGIKNVPAMAPVKIVDVLRNLGGFNEGADSYLNHSLIDASPYGKYPITGEMMYDYVLQGGHLNKYQGIDVPDDDSYWNLSTYTKSQALQKPAFTYSNLGFSMLGELVRILSGLPCGDYVRTNLLEPLNIDDDIYPDPGHRNASDGATQAGLRSYLINEGHRYHSVGCAIDADCNYLVCGANDPNPQDCSVSVCGPNNTCIGCSADNKTCRPGWACVNDECMNINIVTPLLQSERVPKPMKSDDGSPAWSLNTGPTSSTAPATAADLRYAGKAYVGGAPLAAGGWHGNGESLGVFIRTLAQSDFLMPQSTAAQLWSPLWMSSNQNRASNWFYGLGWYVRGNWIAMAGGSAGAMSLILHNRAYDFTVVYLTNVWGNGFTDFLNPLLGTAVWSPVGVPCPGNCSPSPMPQSVLGGPFPCIDDLATPKNECQGFVGAY